MTGRGLTVDQTFVDQGVSKRHPFVILQKINRFF
jgi:hypothetical protein